MSITAFNQSQVIVPSTSGVSNDHVFTVTQELLPALIWAVGLTSTDSIPIKLTPDDGTTKETWFQDGSAVVLTPTNKGEAIKVPMTIVIDKPATVAAVTIYLNSGLHC